MKLLFIRHAETSINANNLTHKTGDPAGLTELGKNQAKQLIRVCRAENVEMVFSSPEQRAIETAEIIAGGLGVQLEVLKELAERNWGEWESKPWSDIEAALKPMGLEERYTFVPPGGESWKQMEERLGRGLEAIIERRHATAAIITHEGALRGIMPLVLNLPKESSFNYHFGNASITSFEYENGRFTELKVNDTSHLEL